MQTTLAGLSFRPAETKNYILRLEEGAELMLERDTDNAYDANAIKVKHAGHFLGFIAKDDAAIIAPQLDEGAHFSCYLGQLYDRFKYTLEVERVG